VINLGVHMLDPAFPHAVLLMEVMPSLLSRREFPPPDTMQTLEPGFRDSPDPGRDLAIVFLRVRAPAQPLLALHWRRAQRPASARNLSAPPDRCHPEHEPAHSALKHRVLSVMQAAHIHTSSAASKAREGPTQLCRPAARGLTLTLP
jgi:hypothetical protein